MSKKIVVLRYGHRITRDYRVTSHCCLVARAFGAEKIIIDGLEDASLAGEFENIVKNWGGDFRIEFTDSWKKTLLHHKNAGFKVVHATMYGKPLGGKIAKIRKCDKILVVIGSQKVEKEVYELSDYNVSVTLQPHSEIAALAVILDYVFEGVELNKKFKNAKLKIVPCNKGKKILKNE